MGRTYTVCTENVAVTAAQDLAQIKGATNKVLRILGVSVGATDTTLPTSQMIRLRCRYLPATVTDGSGGTSPSPQAQNPSDASAAFTAKFNNTTPATTSGTAVVLGNWGVHIYSGLDFSFPEPPQVIPSTSFVFELLSTVSGTPHFDVMITVEEIG